jgi:hypothetical protein
LSTLSTRSSNTAVSSRSQLSSAAALALSI